MHQKAALSLDSLFFCKDGDKGLYRLDESYTPITSIISKGY